MKGRDKCTSAGDSCNSKPDQEENSASADLSRVPPPDDEGISVLLVEESPEDAALVSRMLRESTTTRFQVEEARTTKAAERLLLSDEVDVVLFGLTRHGDYTLECFAQLQSNTIGIPFIALSDEQDDSVALNAMKMGAQDYLVKGEITVRALVRTIRHAIERTRVERALAKERELLENLLAKIPDRIYFKDLRSRFIRINHSCANFFGLDDPREATGKTDFDFFTDEHARPAYEDEQEIIRTGVPMHDKMEKETFPNGETHWALTSKLPLLSKEGKITGTFGLSHDVTELKQMEDALEAERNQLRRLTEELQKKNALLEEDLDMAREVQQAFLPRQYPRFPGSLSSRHGSLHFEHLYRPAAAVGGDFFTVLALSDTRAGVFICDVMGHGLRAALVTAIVRGLIEELRPKASEPGLFLTELNRGLIAILRRVDEPLLSTACYVVADTDTDEVLFARAGHPIPLRVRREARCVEQLCSEDDARGPALGLFDDTVYSATRCKLEYNDLMLLFTDGVYEVMTRDGDVFGLKALGGAVKKRMNLPAGELFEGVLEEVQSAASEEDIQDDVCLLALERCRNGQTS